jgi:hypothetical protein
MELLLLQGSVVGRNNLVEVDNLKKHRFKDFLRIPSGHISNFWYKFDILAPSDFALLLCIR